MEEPHSTQTTVDLMIFDYFVCMAISRIFVAIRQGLSIEHVQWFADMVELFHRLLIHRGALESPLPWDLELKLRIFDLASLFLHWEPPKDRELDLFTPLSDIAVDFMDLCHSAIDNVSNTRWFDLGAHLMVHAMLEEDVRFPDQLRRLYNWTANDLELDAHWEMSRASVLKHMPPPHGTAGPVSREGLHETFSMDFLQEHFVEFFEDLMEGLDVPVILQLECGQLEGLTREETQRIRDQCGVF
ncbi:uncharacterized protein N7515_008465 [Penicillium bovifimosum]|uniref:Uncharacterized protein n=1 Tax=Penicillium bovifimosum TaxID=126998 RepID=A0A9W9GN07_9EURO|nr:uncharacterized protein N7515_008465 [Penicillium bovifimosum]KAJ5124640.1 hypothetical protein N7515_008465 [Penicillium bovifimosum]